MEFNNVINSVTITSRQFVGIGYDNISNNYSDIRTSDNLYDSLKITTDNINDIETNERNIDDSINIYRYKFTNDFTNELYKFSKIHQYDHRKDFKEAWEIWIDDNTNLVDDEVRRLTNLGYDGDILDKMFKSARYYFRKKSTEKKEPVKRRIYVGSQNDLLEAMDDHIKSNISSGEFKPADGFDEFCKKNVDILKDQVNQLIRSGITDSNEIKSKIKKTYKNRYFLIISK
jgi:hypothetical protein